MATAEKIVDTFCKETEELSKGVGKGCLRDLVVLCLKFQEVVQVFSATPLTSEYFKLLFDRAAERIELLTFHYDVHCHAELCKVVQEVLCPFPKHGLPACDCAVDVVEVQEDGSVESEAILLVEGALMNVVLNASVSAAHKEKARLLEKQEQDKANEQQKLGDWDRWETSAWQKGENKDFPTEFTIALTCQYL
jgi:hypothetical protein